MREETCLIIDKTPDRLVVFCNKGVHYVVKHQTPNDRNSTATMKKGLQKQHKNLSLTNRGKKKFKENKIKKIKIRHRRPL